MKTLRRWYLLCHRPLGDVIEILTHWGRVTHICVGKSTIIGSDNGLSPDRRQAIIWTNVGILLIRPLGTYFSEILTGIQTFSFNKMHLKMSSAKWRPFCLGLNVLKCNLRTHARDENYEHVFWNIQNTFVDKSTLIQVIALCPQATWRYLCQCRRELQKKCALKCCVNTFVKS